VIVVSKTPFSLSELEATTECLTQSPPRSQQEWLDLKDSVKNWKSEDVLVVYLEAADFLKFDLPQFLSKNCSVGLVFGNQNDHAFGDFWPVGLNRITLRETPSVGGPLKMACWFKPAGVDEVFEASKNPISQMLYPKVPGPSAPVLFLDRDGVLIEDEGYLDSLDLIRLKGTVIQELKKLQKKGVELVVITNQSGVARGKFTLKFVDETHQAIDQKLAEFGVRIRRWYTSPFHPDGKLKDYTGHSLCRKPYPELVMKAAFELGIDLKRAAMIGDKSTDEFALLNLPTFLLQGQYPIQNTKAPVYTSVEDLFRDLPF